MFWIPEREVLSHWTEHVPFAFWLVDVLRPSTVVELGTYTGVSYSALCQAVRTLNLPTRCFAIDTWKGDQHVGSYSEDVYRDFKAFHDPRYGTFSHLVRSTFDDALPHFADRSIDLLHIDGEHTYEAVHHDLTSWLPKLASNAILIMHDTNVRERGFGVFRLWDQVAAERSHFAFLHGSGLGVLALGHDYALPLRLLFDARNSRAPTNSIRSVFAYLGQSVALLGERRQLDPLHTECEREIATFKHAVAERDATLAAAKEQLATVYASTSWKVTAPMRSLAAWSRRHVRRPRSAVAAGAPRNSRLLTNRAVAYWSTHGTLPFVRKSWHVTRTAVRRALQGVSPSPGPERSFRVIANAPYSEMLARSERTYKSPDYRPEVSSMDFDTSSSKVKMLAFYLPQFHSISENDQWWGKGFTEWTNVTRAVPHFAGHDQPRLPADLGFYDLRNEAALEQQVVLAKKYGIHGFCFHFYWFAGKRLLEKPLETFLKRKDLDLGFCLCWANENWTRRWDGQEHEVLIAQEHSPGDDNRLMVEMCRYMEDARYLTIGGRPIVIVYRVELLPEPSQTAERWRQLVRERLGKDPFLVHAMTFGNVSDPANFGFDAAVQFPPHSLALPEINSQVTFWNDAFSGRIYDYEALVPKAAKQLYSHRFPTFPAVFPGWDNTPRRGSHSFVFARSNPDLYSVWLSEAALYANDKPVHGSSLVFINAWNEWGEGAVLEPDQRHGHAYLRATAEVLRPHCTLTRAPLESCPRTSRGENHSLAAEPAIIVHAYYHEILLDMLRAIPDVSRQPLYISVPDDRQKQFRNLIEHYAPRAAVFVAPNRGRDIRPFLALLRLARDSGHSSFIKLHTKKSAHRPDGANWRTALTRPLLRLCQHGALEALLREHPTVGLVTAKGHVLDGKAYIGAAGNVAWLRHLCALADIGQVPHEFRFAGGTMCAGRIEAIEQVLSPEIAELVFEEEQGRTDGTLAHAFERFFGILTAANGFKIATVEVGNEGGVSVSFGEGCIKGYAFAQRSGSPP